MLTHLVIGILTVFQR